MDKNTRLLLLYSKLMQGESVNKLIFCMETDSHPRSFDWDIEDIRLYLSETFSGEELRYNKRENAYSLTGVRQQPLETMEYLFVERLLLDTGVLREDGWTACSPISPGTRNTRETSCSTSGRSWRAIRSRSTNPLS
ncbi:MAG: hypothetical protein LIO95_04395 [Clostridiales bacterium]|nr:hypothetical protein [Clostridiales bacterium]